MGPLASLDAFAGKVVSLGTSCWPPSAGSRQSSGCDSADGGCARGSTAEANVSAVHATEAPAALLAAACGDGSVRVFDLASIAETSAACNRGSGTSGSAKAALAPLWNLALPSSSQQAGDAPSWSAIAMQQASFERTRTALSPGGRLLALAGPDRRILLLDAETGQQQLSLAAHPASAVRALAWMGPRRLVAAGEDGTALVLDVHSPSN